MEYEDRRVDNIADLKASGKLTFGQVPLWEDANGSLVQSIAIARYLARKYHLLGKDEVEAAKIDVLIDGLEDLRSRRLNAKTDEEKAKFANEVAPQWLGYFETVLKNNGTGFAVGNSFSLADIALYLAADGLNGTHPEVIGKFEHLVKHHQTIGARPKIAAWIARRPVTPF